MKILAPLFTLILTLVLSGSLSAGQLSDELAQKIAALDSDQRVRVWIKLPPSAQAQSFRTSVAAATAVENHRNAINALKEGHTSAQENLLSHLQTLESANRASAIKSHWLVNVIEVDLPVAELASLASRSDIELISPEPVIRSIRPTYEAALSPDEILADSVVDNLDHIKAPQAWAAGFTGAGRVICSFDSGVQGDHPALQRSWRGKGGSRTDSLASWFDPVFHQTAPHTLNGSLSFSHGTHTMGTMVGLDSINDIAYGVAPDAKWISAGVIDIAGASIIDAFEWAADPDGDPNTVADLPDVINHSWGYENRYVGCEDICYEMIDATEALGIVNIFSAGNSGSIAQTIYNPANRANDSLDCFAVGNLQLTPLQIVASSSRGPSTCNGAIKPNVVAPGYQIRSSVPNSTYGILTGTSMAAPHVSGLVALLRQKNPAATVREIKQAILASTQTHGWSVPSNTFGWGEIDCQAALNALADPPNTPRVRVYDFLHDPIAPGDLVSGLVVVQNIGDQVSNLTGTIIGTHPLLTIHDGSTTFGTVAAGAIDTANANAEINVTVSNSVLQGTVITVPFEISGLGYSVTTSLSFVVEPRNSKAIVTHETDRLMFSVSNFGAYGFGDPTFFYTGGEGFNLDSLGNDLLEAGIMATTGPTKVSSAIHFLLTEPNMDFRVAPGGDMTFDTLGGAIHQVSRSVFDDSNATSPIGLEVTQQTFSFADPYSDIVALQYVLKNNSGIAINTLRFGLSLDWDIISYAQNCGGWESAEQFLWTAHIKDSATERYIRRYRGGKLLEGPLATANTTNSFVTLIPWWGTGANGYTDQEKYSMLVSGVTNIDTYKSSFNDLVQTLAAGPLVLAPGQTDTVVFALFGGSDLPTIRNAATRSTFAYALVAGQAPSVAAQILPASDAVIGQLLPTFIWNRSLDPNPNDVVTYTLRFGTDPTLTTASEIFDLADTSFTLTDPLTDLSDYYWQVVATDNVAMSASSPIRKFSIDVSTDIPGDDPNLPHSFALLQNYPNPFNPSTVIAFDLPRASAYSLTVYDITGREVLQRNGEARAGRTEITWNAARQGSGLYLYRLTAGNYSASRKMLLIK
ncbi:MAG: S8 family peptidase [bacterium]|nr:S8 family peptidase [bacterium]